MVLCISLVTPLCSFAWLFLALGEGEGKKGNGENEAVLDLMYSKELCRIKVQRIQEIFSGFFKNIYVTLLYFMFKNQFLEHFQVSQLQFFEVGSAEICPK